MARILVLLFALMYSSVSVGEDLKKMCEQQSAKCFSLIDNHQQNLSNGSDPWWGLETLRLNLLFKFQQIDDFYVALRPWIDHPDVPVKHQPVIAMLYGKWLLRRGRNDEATAVLEEALAGFRTRRQQSESLPLALKTLNVLVILNRFDEAKAYVKELTNSNYDSPLFYREVFAELAHIAHKNNAYQEHVDYRRESVRWAEQVADDQQRAIAYNNYGVALRNNKEYKEAEKAFLAAIKYAKQANDSVQLNKITLRIAEVYLVMQDFNNAQEFLNKIELRYFPPSEIAKYRKLAKQATTAQYGG